MKRSLVSPIFSLLIVSAAGLRPATAGDAIKSVTAPTGFRQEGRPAEPVPPGADAVPLTPPPGDASGGTSATDPKYGGVLYERNRIKRTVPLDPPGGLDSRWDVLYRYVDTLGGQDEPGGSGVRTVYFDWDNDYLYLAMEAPRPTDVRFDLDAAGDGWLRGADNLSIQVSPPPDGSAAPTVLAQRFDTVQNRDRPVYAESPIPASAMKIRVGATPSGAYGVVLALPRTEIVGLDRKPGTTFGLRVDTGLLPAQVGAADVLSIRPMLRLTLADEVAAQTDNGLQVRVLVLGGRQKNPGDDLRLSLEAKNTGKLPVRLARLFLRGSKGTQPLLDSASYTGFVLEPGKSIKRDLRSILSASAQTGAYVVTGGAETQDGASIAALASFDRLEPYALEFKLDQTPISPRDFAAPTTPKNPKKGTTASLPSGVVRVAVASVLSRVYSQEAGMLRLQLPTGWSLESGEASRSIPFRFAGDTKVQYFRILVPRKTAPGAYPITATLEVAGRTYTVSQNLTVRGAARATASEQVDRS